MVDLAILGAYPAYQPTPTEADRIDAARQRLDRGLQDPEVREDSFFDTADDRPIVDESTDSYDEDIQDLEQLHEDDKDTVRSLTVPSGQGPGGKPLSLTPRPERHDNEEAVLLSGKTADTGEGTRTSAPSIILSENMTSEAASDGEDEANVLRNLKTRKGTSASDEPVRTVVAAYQDGNVLGFNGEPIQVSMNGTYFNKLWTQGASGLRLTNSDMRVAQKYSQAYGGPLTGRNSRPRQPNTWKSLKQRDMKEDVESIIRAIKSDLTDKLIDVMKILENDTSELTSEAKANIMLRVPTHLARMVGALAPEDEGTIGLQAEWKNLEKKLPA
ncbi:hypothetical protein IL306_014175 [Fusarium sp. DS 682]|nr:hypothetical protein IL306_014175 [Fusarium sp. DS 682]